MLTQEPRVLRLRYLGPTVHGRNAFVMSSIHTSDYQPAKAVEERIIAAVRARKGEHVSLRTTWSRFHARDSDWKAGHRERCSRRSDAGDAPSV